ncbi:hypothetical protein Kpol_1028p84 [Vanderwaltozyma polyspora DSM 70294]|uniref:Flavodoxin-like domain-containing protein n=1 Tax=Vanderwaltozyma polyspora (strain ATCC 22028 / DSM 70294 / BCRC 21397 / CBS 2163 / NBRC 10782 / NRRL Y-8283 / UCD 57-17) TaxID=436907 RepID=A7TG51_VANPO|nr:uncharacterized protein Kpol_1028p84 [Vanderwaltozyma polyspora DSM 70294]EDO18808.1 hypothetical protein Kpol_1028p84 [Vanderwaltozyma polyspora DSM 70294]
MVKIAIISYSMYGHVDTLARKIKEGIESAGGKVDLFRVEETLPPAVLEKMHAVPRDETIPIIDNETLVKYDAFLLGIPTRYGNCSAQWSAFWDKTGGLWVQGTLAGKAAGIFVCSGTYGGGQESTVKNNLSYLAHHGIVFIPLGYKETFADLANLDEVHGGSPWGAGTLAGSDGSRAPSELELRLAKIQGKRFYEIVNRMFPETLKDSAKKAVAGNAAQKGQQQGQGQAQAAQQSGKQAVQQGKQTATKAAEDKGSHCCTII